MQQELGNEKTLVISYLTLRKAIGILGTALPFVVSLGALIVFQTGIQSSLSSYYYTGMRDVFVGTLWAIGFFLLSYKGYERTDEIAGDLGCVFAVGVSLFPTAPDCATSCTAQIIGHIHLIFATLFFLTLIYFSLCLFTKTDPTKPPSIRKKQRNIIYKVCGYVMSVCVLLIAVYYFLPKEAKALFKVLNPVYWLEATAIVAFGISWLIKGEAILKDETQVITVKVS
jgi:hypothetical protein